MFTRSAASPQVHLHWLRETPSRALEFPASQVLDSPDSLPPSLRTAVLDTGLPVVELHVSPYRHGEAVSFEAWCDALAIRTDAGGRLIATRAADPDPAATIAFHQAMILVLRAVAGDRTPLTLVAEPAPSAVLSQPVPRVHRCQPGGGLAAAPAERTKHYFASYRNVSVAIQLALRQYLPPAQIDSLRTLEDRSVAIPLLVWSAANPAFGRNVDQIGVDVHSKTMMDRAFRHLPVRLVPLLTEAHDILAGNGLDAEALRYYKPSRAEKIAANCRAARRPIHQLFFHERRLIDGFVNFCIQIEAWRKEAGAGTPGRVYRAARAAWEGVEVDIRRLAHRRFHATLGSLLLVEAVQALEAYQASLPSAAAARPAPIRRQRRAAAPTLLGAGGTESPSPSPPRPPR